LKAALRAMSKAELRAVMTAARTVVCWVDPTVVSSEKQRADWWAVARVEQKAVWKVDCSAVCLTDLKAVRSAATMVVW